MGCIILELATLIVYGWEIEKVTEFRQRRKENSSKTRPNFTTNHPDDNSFHNNQNIVDNWVRLLEGTDDSQEMISTLKIASQMMDQERYSWLYSQKVELNLYEIQDRHDDRDAGLEKGAPHVQRPAPELQKAGWSLDARDSKNLTPWNIFERTQPPDRCNALCARLFSNISRKASSDKVASDKALVRKRSSEGHGQELLMTAARSDLNIIQDFIGEGVDSLFVDECNRSVLFKAVENNQHHVAKSFQMLTGRSYFD